MCWPMGNQRSGNTSCKHLNNYMRCLVILDTTATQCWLALHFSIVLVGCSDAPNIIFLSDQNCHPNFEKLSNPSECVSVLNVLNLNSFSEALPDFVITWILLILDVGDLWFWWFFLRSWGLENLTYVLHYLVPCHLEFDFKCISLY